MSKKLADQDPAYQLGALIYEVREIIRASERKNRSALQERVAHAKETLLELGTRRCYGSCKPQNEITWLDELCADCTEKLKAKAECREAETGGVGQKEEVHG